MHRQWFHSMFLVVDNERQIQLDWLNAILKTRKWRPNRLAVSAGVDPSALSRFLNDPSGKRTLNSYTVEKIAAASGFPAFETDPENVNIARSGYTVGDGAPFNVERPGELQRAIAAIQQDRNGIDAWVLTSRCLENAGYLPGDVLMIDRNARPKKGDIVVAMVYDRSGHPETTIRLLGEPFLYSSSMDPAFMEPILIDKNVVIVGTMVTSLRERRAAA